MSRQWRQAILFLVDTALVILVLACLAYAAAEEKLLEKIIVLTFDDGGLQNVKIFGCEAAR